MKPTPQAIENAARAVKDEFSKFVAEFGYREARAIAPGNYRLIRAALSGDLGDMVLVPKEALHYIASNSGERTIRDMARAMLAAAAEDSAAGLGIVEK